MSMTTSPLVRLVQKTLGRSGFNVEHAASGDEALAMIAARTFDVIALDHHLANGTGLDLLSRLAVAADAPPVVYVTGSTEDERRGRGAQDRRERTSWRRRSVTISSSFSARHCSTPSDKARLKSAEGGSRGGGAGVARSRRDFCSRKSITALPTAWPWSRP